MIQDRGIDIAQWELWAKYFPIGSDVEGEVLDVWQVGAHLRLAHGAEALLLNGELSWDGFVPDAREVLRPGERVKVQVVSTEPRRHRIYVSLRRAAHDPWKEHGSSYRKGWTARARVTQFIHDEVLIEFEDHVSGYIPRTEVAKGIARPEDILEIGDWVEVKVIDRDETSREVKASMKLRRAEIEEDIRGGPAVVSVAPNKDLPDDEEPEVEIAPAPLTGGPRILIAENEAVERLQLRAILEDLGFRHVAEAASGPEVVEMARQCGFDIIFMDQEMPAGNGDAGIRAAEKIKSICPDAIIVLATGNEPAWGSPDHAPDFLSGMITKPFNIEKIRAAMMRLRDTGSAEWPEVHGVEVDEIPSGVQFIERISRTPHAARPLGEVLNTILSELNRATGACGTALFNWSRSTKQVDMEAAVGVREGDFHYCRPNLHKSPVADLVYEPNRPIFFRNIEKDAAGKFLYLRPILGPPEAGGGWPLESCIGEYVGEEFDNVYTLFVFGDRVDQFGNDERILTRAAASVARSAIREHWIVEQVVSERRLTTLGGIVTSAAHELRGRLNALDAVNSVERSWKQLRAHPEKLFDEAFLKDIEARIAGLRKAKQSMETVVSKILGWVRTADDSMVNVRLCLEKAIAACADLAVKSKVIIRTDLGFAPEIRANAVDLEQAFLNLVLNAVLHMHKQPGLLAIDLRCAHQKDGPIQVRFRDTGPGIHSRYLDKTIWGEERIFQPLFTTKQSGTGMGLYIVRGLLANHGASVCVEKTAIGAGTTILVEIPISSTRR